MFYLHQQAGLSLIEMLIVLSLLAISLGCAIPTFSSYRDHLRLQHASAQLVSDLQWARSESGRRNRPVRWSWRAYPDGVCYFLHTGSPSHCHCSLSSVHCEPGSRLLKSVRWARKDPISFQSNVASIHFDPALGTSTPAARLKLTTLQGKSIEHVINVMGRIRTCSSTNHHLGLPGC